MRLFFTFLAAFALLSCFLIAPLLAQPGSQIGWSFLLGVLCTVTVICTVAAARADR